MPLTEKDRSTRNKTYPSATFSTTNSGRAEEDDQTEKKKKKKGV